MMGSEAIPNNVSNYCILGCENPKKRHAVCANRKQVKYKCSMYL